VVQFSYNLPSALKLTAGNTYYWGVTLTLKDGRVEHHSVPFHTKPVDKPEGASFRGVTIITPDRDLVNLGTRLPKHAPSRYFQLTHAIAGATDGVIEVYDKATGKFFPLTQGAEAGILGKSLIMVMDWTEDSYINDSGFSEGAADAFFASLVA